MEATGYQLWPSDIAEKPAYEVDEFWQFQDILRREHKERQKKMERNR